MASGHPTGSTASPSGGRARAAASNHASGLVRFIRRHPLLSFFVWFFTVGQAFAFLPVLVPGTGVAHQTFIIASTLVGLLLPTLLITYLVDGRDGIRALWRHIAKVKVGAGWYGLALIGLPLLAAAITVAFAGWPTDVSVPRLLWLLLPSYLLPLLVTFVLNNLWEEVAWMGFVQARLQARHGAFWAAMITGPLFALQHISLLVGGGSVLAGLVLLVVFTLLTTPFRFLTGWMYNRTASLFLVGLVHAAGNAAASGSGYQQGYLSALYPGQQIAGLSHLLASAALGLIVVIATRGRLGKPSDAAQRQDSHRPFSPRQADDQDGQSGKPL